MFSAILCGLLLASFTGSVRSQRQVENEELVDFYESTPQGDTISDFKLPGDLSDIIDPNDSRDTWVTELPEVPKLADSDVDVFHSMDSGNITEEQVTEAADQLDHTEYLAELETESPQNVNSVNTEAKPAKWTSKPTKERNKQRKRQRTRQRNKQVSKEPNKAISIKTRGTNQTLEVLVNRTGQSCGFNNDGIVIDVGNQTENIYRVCYNEMKYFTYFVKSRISGESLVKHLKEKSEKVKKVQLRFWTKRGIHLNVDMDDLYKRNNQIEAVNSILGPNATTYVSNSSRSTVFLSRGHLAPRADFIDVMGQKASYNFLNVAPQWQIINAGSWGKLENAVRNLATKNHKNLDITTGTFGVLQLPDSNRKFHDIYLGVDKNNNHILPVPKYFWKIVQQPDSGNATAVIVINNPHLNRVAPSDIFCVDVCHEISWINWPTRNINKGYMFCCAVDDLRAIVNYVPVSSSGLLK